MGNTRPNLDGSHGQLLGSGSKVAGSQFCFDLRRQPRRP